MTGYASSSGDIHAFVWSTATGMIDLGTLGGRTEGQFVTEASTAIGT